MAGREAEPAILHRFGLILVLRLLILAGDHCAGWYMRDTHGRVSRIDRLSPGPEDL